MVSIYYATVMVLTTGATILGVIVLRIHHQGRRGLPVTCKAKRNTGILFSKLQYYFNE